VLLLLATVALLTSVAIATRTVKFRTRPARAYAPDDYGLLRTLVLVESLDTGLSVRALLTAGGVRATVGTGSEGLVHVLVFPDEYDRGRRMVSWVL
jgi:hypothetical protein